MIKTQAQTIQESLDFIQSLQEKKYKYTQLAKHDLETAKTTVESVKEDGNYNPKLCAAYFKSASKMVEKFPDWLVLGYLTTNTRYRTDAGGQVYDIFNNNKAVEQFPLGEMAKVAPKEFKEFALTSLTYGKNRCDEFAMNEIFRNYKAFGLNISDLIDITHQAIQKRKEINRQPMDATAIFLNNPELLQPLLQKYPEDFTAMAKESAGKGWDIIRIMGNGEDKPVSPILQNWIEKNPKDYASIVQTAINQHCSKYRPADKKAQFDGIMHMVNKEFLAKNPDFEKNAYYNMQGYVSPKNIRTY